MESEMPRDVQEAFRKAGLSRRRFLQAGGVGVAGAAAFSVAGCGTGGGKSGAKMLNRNLGAEVDDLDSATATDEVSFEILTNVKEGLYRLGPDENPQPAMAKGVEVSDDGLVYTFTLRDGVKWSNGDPVTTADFRFAWLRALDPATASQYAYIVAKFIKGAEKFNAGEGSREDVAIEAIDDKTLKVTLTAPIPFFKSMTAFPTYFPQHEKFVKAQGKNYAMGKDKLLYNGPYMLTQFDAASGGMMETNPKYWDNSNVDIEQIKMRVVKDRNTALRLYKKGDLDITGLSGEQVARHKNDPELFRYVGFTNFFGQMNQKDPAMANLNIRKALLIGFDRKALVNQVLKDGSEAAYAFVPPGMEGPKNKTFREANGPQFSGTPSQARQYWEQGVKELGRTPEITMLFGQGTTAREISTFIQQQYRENLGIKAKIDMTPFEAALDRMNNYQYQLSFASGWGADYNDPLTFLSYFLSDSGFNRSAWSNAEYDRLVNGAREESDNLKRMQMMMKAERILFDEAVCLPEYYEAVVGLVKPYVKNFLGGSHPYSAEPDWKWVRLANESS